MRLTDVGRWAATVLCVVQLAMLDPRASLARELRIAVPRARQADLPSLPNPNPFGVDGPPRPLTDVIVDGQTRFLVSGQAEARCPRDRIVFVVGVVNAFRPTVPGDGAFMCHADAVAQGFFGP